MNKVIIAKCSNCLKSYRKLESVYGKGRAIKLKGVRAAKTRNCSRSCSKRWNEKPKGAKK